MSSSGSGERRAAPAEHHLGDRLAAFVDGELTDDTRDRVLAHLATCPQCKAAAAEQRRLKNAVAASGLPAISSGLLERLQALAGCADGSDDGPGPGDGSQARSGAPAEPGESGGSREQARRGPFEGGLLGSGVFGGRREEFSYLSPARDLVAPDGSRARGFRIHELTRAASAAEQDEPAVHAEHSAWSASRSRRFAFAAAGAFSLAAIAIGGALPMEAAVDGGARPDDGPAVSPLSANSVSDTRGVTPRGLLETGEDRLLRAPAAFASAASVASATSVSLTRPLLAPGAVPLVTPAASPIPPSHSSVVLH